MQSHPIACQGEALTESEREWKISLREERVEVAKKMATDSKTPTPSKDVDVFGKGLGLTGMQFAYVYPEYACVDVCVNIDRW